MGRYTEPKPGKASILKDNNFLENHRKLRMGPAKRAVFLEQIKRDSEVRPSPPCPGRDGPASLRRAHPPVCLRANT